jgi:hypothetical protein
MSKTRGAAHSFLRVNTFVMNNSSLFKNACTASVLPLLILLGSLAYFGCTKEVSPVPPDDPGADNDTTKTQNPPLLDSIIYREVNVVLKTDNTEFALELPEVDSSLSIGPIIFRKSLLGGGNWQFQMKNTPEVTFLDLATFGYLTAQRKCDEVNTSSSYWKASGQLLNTVNSGGGDFFGQKNRYLAFRIENSDKQYYYGWIRLTCSTDFTQLTISDFAIRTAPDSTVYAGQKVIGAPCDSPLGTQIPIQEISDIEGYYHDENDFECSITVGPPSNAAFDFSVQFFPFLWPYYRLDGHLTPDGKLQVPEFTFSGNLPSPGGTPRLFSGYISGTATLYIKENGKKVLLWDISMNKTGFMPQSYLGDFWSEKCD